MNDQIRSISPEERRKLSQAFQEHSAKAKAEEINAAKDGMRQRIVDGKYQWVEQAKVLQEEERKKRVLATSRPIRALRDGENSLVAHIQKTLHQYSNCMNQFKQSGYLPDMDYIDCKNTANKIVERTETFSKQLTEVEDKIELTKSQNPLFKEAEKVLYLMNEYMKMNKKDQAIQLQKQNGQLIASYQKQRKSLAPLVDNARHLRADLQREYWRIMQALWNLHKSVFTKELKTSSDKLETLDNPDWKANAGQELQEANHQFESLAERENTLRSSLPANILTNDEFARSWDEILPDMSSILVEMEFLSSVMQNIMLKFDSIEDTKSTQPTNRMVFTSKKGGST